MSSSWFSRKFTDQIPCGESVRIQQLVALIILEKIQFPYLNIPTMCIKMCCFVVEILNTFIKLKNEKIKTSQKFCLVCVILKPEQILIKKLAVKKCHVRKDNLSVEIGPLLKSHNKLPSIKKIYFSHMNSSGIVRKLYFFNRR